MVMEKKKKPVVSKNNIKTCLRFAQKYNIWTINEWK